MTGKSEPELQKPRFHHPPARQVGFGFGLALPSPVYTYTKSKSGGAWSLGIDAAQLCAMQMDYLGKVR
jgi:hypothetical protein